MPRNLSARVDLIVILCGALISTLLLFLYDTYLGITCTIIWIFMAVFAFERSRHRHKTFEEYHTTLVSTVDYISNYALDKMPMMIFAINHDGIIRWHNKELEKQFDTHLDLNQNISINKFWTEFDITSVWGNTGEMVYAQDEYHFNLHYSPLGTTDDGVCQLMIIHAVDISEMLLLIQRHEDSRSVFASIQIDNYDEVMKGITEAERATLSYETNKILDEWIVQLNGSLRRIATDTYVAFMEYKDLTKARESKFDIIDKVHTLVNSRRLPVTVSMGIATSEGYTINSLDMKSQEELDMALSRGGDQVALFMDGKTEFYGGKAQAMEKNTRVKARVMTQSLIDHMGKADEIFIMGHVNEDFDALGASIGIARIAREMKKPVHIVISDTNASIDKLMEILRDKEPFVNMLVSHNDLVNITAESPLLIVVDTHIPHMVAAPDLLERIDDVIVIDHHRRSENYIRNTQLSYLEPSASSTSEMVTEMIQYYPVDIILSHLEATSLYAGILVDTKNFVVQTGARTFDASSYIRRSGLDTVLIRQLFKTDYATDIAKAKTKASSQMFPNGLVVAFSPDCLPNIQVIAAQTADSLLRIDKVRASIVVFQLKPDIVGISARSTGDVNVQLIMEKFGGGGHQNVAGAQIKNKPLDDVYQAVIDISNKFIEELDNHENNIAAGR